MDQFFVTLTQSTYVLCFWMRLSLFFTLHPNFLCLLFTPGIESSAQRKKTKQTNVQLFEFPYSIFYMSWYVTEILRKKSQVCLWILTPHLGIFPITKTILIYHSCIFQSDCYCGDTLMSEKDVIYICWIGFMPHFLLRHFHGAK